MKKTIYVKAIFISLNIVLFIFVMVLLLKGEKKIPENKPENTIAETAPKEKISAPDCNIVCIKKIGSFHYLDGNLLLQMADSYRFHYQKPISNAVQRRTGVSSNDASSIWFSLDSLKQFIWEIESNTCKNRNSVNKNLNLGIRIYYARYPVTGIRGHRDLKGLPEEFENMHTVFMVPTFDKIIDKKNNIIQHIDCDPQYGFSKFNEPVEIQDIQKNDKLIQHLTAMSAGMNYYPAFNHGGICPPVCSNTGLAFGK